MTKDEAKYLVKEIYLWYMFLAGFLFGLVVLSLLLFSSNRVKPFGEPSLDLPEEYMLINPHEQLQGNYDKSTNTLHIWFNNPQKQ